MSEVSIFNANAVVYYFDAGTGSWKPSPETGYSSLAMYKNTANNTYRVIGTGLQNAKGTIVINSPVTKDTVYTKSSPTFHTWQDSQKIYGVTFGTPQDAQTFGNGFDSVIAELKNPKPVAPPPKPAPPAAPAAPPKPAAPTPPAAPAAPKPPAAPAAPKAPPAPAAPAASAGGAPPAGRGALLDSIQNFSKSGLKKVQTIDKSAPMIEGAPRAAAGGGAGPAARPAPGGGSGGGGAAAAPAPVSFGGGGGDMMAEMMSKRAMMAKKSAGGAAAPATPATPAAPKPAAPSTPSPFNKPAVSSINKPAVPATPPAVSNAGGFRRDSSPAAPTPAATQSSSSIASKLTNEELITLKAEIMAEIRAEIAQLKQDLLAAMMK